MLNYSESKDNIESKRGNIKNFNFVAAGDFGCGDEPNRTVVGMIKKNPELVLALGDLSYNKSATCWLNTKLLTQLGWFDLSWLGSQIHPTSFKLIYTLLTIVFLA